MFWKNTCHFFIITKIIIKIKRNKQKEKKKKLKMKWKNVFMKRCSYIDDNKN